MKKNKMYAITYLGLSFLISIFCLGAYESQKKFSIDYSSYPDFEELTVILKQLADDYPDLVVLNTAGKSFKGRELWYVEVTDRNSGEAEKKPAIYMDGNMHACEVLGTSICIKTIDYLTADFKTNPGVNKIMQNYAFYIFPRVSPDGAEYFLKTPYTVRSVLRPYPFKEKPDGLYPEDIDGDGHIVQMRIKNPDGKWKISEQDKRLMLLRESNDTKGLFYDLYEEGLIRNFNGKEIVIAPPEFGIDLNRNFPANWSPYQSGAGPFPLCEPESRAIADLVRRHSNIGMRVCYHTAVGTINRPFNTKPDEEMLPKDLAAFKILGKLGKEFTGYPMVSVYEEFGTRKHPNFGTSLEWHYEHMGLFSFVFESWDIEKRAGCGDYERNIPYQREYGESAPRTEEEWLKILRWADDVVGEEAFKCWEPFNHPQLGEVEIGGWRKKFVTMNPPPKLLREEIENDMMFGIEIAKLLPLIKINSITYDEMQSGLYRIFVTVENIGFFPTNITDQAKKLGRAMPVQIYLDILSGGELADSAKKDLGHLDGTWDYDASGQEDSKKTVSWFVRVSDVKNFKARVKVRSEKAGTIEREFNLER